MEKGVILVAVPHSDGCLTAPNHGGNLDAVSGKQAKLRFRRLCGKPMNEARELWRHQRTDNSECNFATIDVVYLAHGIPASLEAASIV